ncbi:hypothetical protein LTR56_006626 [Elasticomyces elasticus]|nr:hypothetical protein LTR56_006626 [Elasticomyces elasticus]KAK3664487.1 hypothetical protein LTR22_004621 [Elasticomyces elasticus]KAK4931792.1 hypothetical protein LTR49_001857 [Elasticomyces elasticus]KAK5762896.1 hypothetical protein LTS12_006883 [Elasticomyces elasticus]
MEMVTFSKVPEVVNAPGPTMATPINTTSAPLDTKHPGATPLSLEMDTDSGLANTTAPAKKTLKKRKLSAKEDEDIKRPSKRDASDEGNTSSQHSDDVRIKDESENDGDVPTWNPDRKEKKAHPAGAKTASGKGKTASGKGKAAVVKDEADDEDDEDRIIAVFGPDNPTFSGSNTITLAVKIKFEESISTKPVPPKDRVQITAPFDFDPNTARGTQPDKETSYHDQAAAYVLSAAGDPQHNSMKISHLNTSLVSCQDHKIYVES